MLGSTPSTAEINHGGQRMLREPRYGRHLRSAFVSRDLTNCGLENWLEQLSAGAVLSLSAASALLRGEPRLDPGDRGDPRLDPAGERGDPSFDPPPLDPRFGLLLDPALDPDAGVAALRIATGEPLRLAVGSKWRFQR